MDRSAGDTLSLKAARELLGCDYRVVKRLAQEGRIGTRRLPHSHVRYFRSDVERLARESVVKAKVKV